MANLLAIFGLSILFIPMAYFLSKIENHEKQKFWYSIIIALTAILIAITILIFQTLGSTLAEAGAYDPTQINLTQTQMYLTNCRSGNAPFQITLAMYENFSFDLKSALIRLCILMTVTKEAVWYSLVTITLIILSIIFGVTSESSTNKHIRFFMWSSAMVALAIQIYWIVTFVY